MINEAAQSLVLLSQPAAEGGAVTCPVCQDRVALPRHFVYEIDTPPWKLDNELKLVLQRHCALCHKGESIWNALPSVSVNPFWTKENFADFLVYRALRNSAIEEPMHRPFANDPIMMQVFVRYISGKRIAMAKYWVKYASSKYLAGIVPKHIDPREVVFLAMAKLQLFDEQFFHPVCAHYLVTESIDRTFNRFQLLFYNMGGYRAVLKP